MNESTFQFPAESLNGSPLTMGTLPQSYRLPSYVTPGSWLNWNTSQPCPAGHTCTKMGNSSFGAFSCNELARIAEEEFGFGNVLAGTYCPEGTMGVLNCEVGGYCPDSTTWTECPAGQFCPYKTYDATESGGSTNCQRCPAGAKGKYFSKSQIVLQAVIFAILCLLLVIKVIKRKMNIDKELLKKKLNLSSKKNRNPSSRTVVKREQEKYDRLLPKLELIATRLDKIQRPNQAQDHGGASVASPSMSRGHLDSGDSFLRLNKAGNIIFDANRVYDVLDADSDGLLSYSEINKVLCLSETQLNAFISCMRDRMPDDHTSDRQSEGVSRSVFVKNFLDVLADASQLEPTADEAEDLFDRISNEVGTTDSGEVMLEQLYNSSLSSFLSDLQIYLIIKQFKQEGSKKSISKQDFVKFYPLFLSQVSQPDYMSKKDLMGSLMGSNQDIGLDVAFADLSLTVSVGSKHVNVVDGVTGRLRSNTMTAFMGGSGAGKSSLLNALCGRAYYGEVTGAVKINGNDSSIEEQKALIGFVPQDDIVYPELTVRENLMYSGRLQLPAGTTEEEIAELADTTMAALGLSRIRDSLVGDATRRGVSGGEKKRVNIGLELMKRPKILFLDEPTSGLDSRSAFVVMESLKCLVSTQGMTVAAVIHQPRTDIFDMFDSLFLLGVGGNTVYHGPTTEARSYFERLGFQMQHGESQADWFLDISSGDIQPVDDAEARGTIDENIATQLNTRDSQFGFEVALLKCGKDVGFVLEQPDGVSHGRFDVKAVGNIRYATVSADKLVGINGHGVGGMTIEDANALLSEHDDELEFEDSVFVQLIRLQLGDESCANAEDDNQECEKSLLITTNKPVGKEDEALAKARISREKLYRHFHVHFDNLPADQKAAYFDPPKAFGLPKTPKAVSFWRQLLVQYRRNSLLSWRNRDSKIIEFGIMLVAIFAMTLLGGVRGSSNWNHDPAALMWVKFIASPIDASELLLPAVFMYSFMGVNAIINYAMMVGLVVSVLVGLNSTGVITDKSLEFFREAQSGTSVTAFYIAATATATIEQGFSVISGSALAYLILKPTSAYTVYLWNFFILSWLSVSWSILLAIITPKSSVATVVGFFNAFFGLLFCGKVQPGTYKQLYNNPALAVFSGFVSPLRFFVEGIAVSEARCLPIQSGYTVASNAFSYPEFLESYPYWSDLTYMAHTDLDAAVTQSCSGWFWWAGAAIAVGVTIRILGGVAIHFSGRSQQGKKKFREECIDDFQKCRSGLTPIYKSFILAVILAFMFVAGFFVLSCWLILRDNSEQNDRYSSEF